MKNLVIGILAHVDAGKTTLSEAVLYSGGSIRKLGRVDNRDAFLDTYALERERGITIFSKQALLEIGDVRMTLLDTPGHVDFSAEMERTLQVLDYAVLVISGADGVQGHTQTLWRLLKRYEIPVFLFINKMDQPGADGKALIEELKKRLDEGCIRFDDGRTDTFCESVAMTEEAALTGYLERGALEETVIQRLIRERKVFPCYFGSALKLEGVETFMRGLLAYARIPEYKETFGARVFKIARDRQGNRLTFLKVTGGSLKARVLLAGGKEEAVWEEKVNQIRLYSGEKYSVAEEAPAGSICAVTGLSRTFPGEGLGAEGVFGLPMLEPVLTYRMELPEGCDAAALLPKLRQLEEEEPQLHIVWDEGLKEIRVKIMGEVQTEIQKSLIEERFGVKVEFAAGGIIYKETIADRVEGVGHFEPLKHYAEVHLLLEPGEKGSGLQFLADVSEDELNGSWQRLILSSLEEKEHKGVLMGAAITDMRITLIAGRAHTKHTEGGDFRQAACRALRQGLMQARSILLEPYYEFTLEVPEKLTGRAMADIDRMAGRFEAPHSDSGVAVLTGAAPVAAMQHYQKEVTAYTKGHGRLGLAFIGYEPCHNAEEVTAHAGYVAERDTENPSASVFCSHGAGFVVEWNRVRDYMHVASRFQSDEEIMEAVRIDAAGRTEQDKTVKNGAQWLGTEEVDAILERTYHANKRDKGRPGKGISGKGTFGNRKTGRETKMDSSMGSSVLYETQPAQKREPKEEYLLVDGYNVIFAWEELRSLAERSVEGARGRLLDILCNYQGIRQCSLMVVFDAYRVQGHDTEVSDYHNIRVVFTKEAETADQYIEKFAHENGRKYQVTVATSDGLEQVIIRGQGCLLLSARELLWEVARANEILRDEYDRKQTKTKNYLFDSLPDKAAAELGKLKLKKGEPEVPKN